jgi:hypothetical protein
LTDPAAAIPDLTGWLGLDAEAATVEEMLSEAGIEFNVDPAAPGARAGKWRSLPSHQLSEFERVAGTLNAELGYEPAAEAADAPSPAVSVRRIMQPVRAIGRRIRGSDSHSRSFEREAIDRMDDAQHLFERLLEAMQIDPDRIREMTAQKLTVHQMNGDDEWTARGPDAVDRLIATVREDRALTGRQVRGDVLPGIPSFTALLAFELADGSRAERVISARIANGKVASVTLYSPAA